LITITRLEIFGWGWFADRTTFAFSPTVTCLQSSNPDHSRTVLDAIRWCLLGDSIAHAHVLYPGSPRRSPMPLAEVTVVSRWSDGEHAMTRRRTRDAPDLLLWDGQPADATRIRDMAIVAHTRSGSTYALVDCPPGTAIQTLMVTSAGNIRQRISTEQDASPGGYQIDMAADGVLVAHPRRQAGRP
jgi:hypothetical protein